MKLTDFKALTFDCYGTLIDWETGMIEALKPLTSKVERPLSRNDILKRMRAIILATASNAGETLPRSAGGCLSPSCRGMEYRRGLE